ncbi:MAG: 23S rRNA (pseudouridine(1915)-N(3))-methyltransferase RlmH [Bacteroidia bacterium]|nr:23S rRNA (pseudouridine(1915)-N(3))-methyltransferase RlmH [Bacteroidia bacterium]
MKIKLLQVSKTEEKYLETGIEQYKNRLKHYIGFEEKTLKSPSSAKNKPENEQKLAEGKEILAALSSGDKLFLLDERGKSLSSVEFANFFNKEANMSTKQLVFVIGGPYGFSEEVYKKADGMLSLSKMTFSHQMVRLFFLEQVYRAFTIIKGEKYHHG